MSPFLFRTLIPVAAIFSGFAIIFPDARFFGVLLIAGGSALFVAMRKVGFDEEIDAEEPVETAEDDPESDIYDERWVVPRSSPPPMEACVCRQPDGMKASSVE